MKLKLIAMVALAACTAAAMPTRDEIAKANQEVRKSLKAQIAAWKDGKLSDGELAGLMLAHADKFKDEARHYACLQASFAAAVRAGDAIQAARALEKIAAETKDFEGAAEKALFEKAFTNIDGEKAKKFRYLIETERAKLSYTTSVTDGTAAAIAKMKTIVIPSLDIKEGTTLANALLTLCELGKKYDTVAKSASDKGFMINVVGTSVVFGNPFSEQKDVVPANDTTPALPAVSTGAISFYDAVNAVVTSANMDFNVSGTVGIAGIDVIPKMPVVVLGAVAHPRKIFVHDVRDLTVTKAIELAGGFKGAADQCLVVVLQIPNASAKASADKSGTMMRPQRKGRLSDFAKGEAADLHSGDIVMVVDGGLLASALGSNDPHAIVGGISLMNNKMFDDLLKLVGNDPRFPKSDIIKAKAMLNGAFTGNLRKYEQDAGIVRVTGNGKPLFYAIEKSNIERKAAGLPSAWPRTTVEKAKEDDPDISELAIKSAADYFAVLFDVKNTGTANWMPYVAEHPVVCGEGAFTGCGFVADALDWCVAANVQDDMPDNVPVLVTANFNPALLLRRWNGKTDANKILPIGPASGASRSMFNDVAIVVVYKGGSVKRIDAEKLTYAAIYGKAFDATKGNPQLAYLTPTRVAEPTGGK